MESISINIIHDTRLIDRKETLIHELFRQGIKDYRIWPPVEDVNSSVRSINLSQKKIVQMAKDMKLPFVFIGEDDLMFPSANGWKYFLSNMPYEFDIYLGGSYLIDETMKLEAPLVKVKYYVGHHCIIVHSRYYDKFLETPEELHIDTAQEGKGEFYLCYPMPALQRQGWSCNVKAIVDYNSILKPENIYH